MKAFAVLRITPLLIAMTILTGCTSSDLYPDSYKAGCSVTTGGGKPNSTTCAAEAIWKPGGGAGAMALAELTNAVNAGYTIIITAPSNELALDPNNPAQATLTATTDTGYTASILVNMTFVSSAPSTLVSGDTDYTFSLPASDALANWVNTVNLNTSKTATVGASSSTTFILSGIPGTYTVYLQIASPQIGKVAIGESTFTDTTSTSDCGSGTSHPGAGTIECPGPGTN
jgi:hypothetical protein